MIEIFIATDNDYVGRWDPLTNSIRANTKEKFSLNEIDQTILKPVKFNLRNTSAVFSRWWIPDMTKSDKAIYLDADVIVTGDIKELWDIDLKDNYVAAVPSYICKTIDDLRFKRIQGDFPSNREPNFLSGQMVINCKKWREDNIRQKLTEFTRKYKVLDEAALNVVCAGKIKELDKYWCVPANYVSEGYKHPQMLYDYDLDKVKLWHWSGPNKPWDKPLRNKEIYEKYCC